MTKKIRESLAMILVASSLATGCAGNITMGTMAARLVTAPIKRHYAMHQPRQDAALDAIVERASLTFERPSADSTPVAILDVRGTPYEMGYQQGRLLKNEVRETINDVMKVARLVTFDRQLQEIYEQQRPYIPQAYQEEMQGLADGSGLDINIVHWAHVVPEITEHMCSGYALLQGTTKDGGTYHVRLLDYGIQLLNMQKHPAVVIYHPDNGFQHANFTWAGFIGSVGGVNETRLSIGEITGGDSQKEDPERMDGFPFPFLYRHVLANAANVAEAEKMIADARRTQNYIYVLSDGKSAEILTTGPHLFDVANADGEMGRAFNWRREFIPPKGVVAYSYMRFHKKLVENLTLLNANGGAELEDIMRLNVKAAREDNMQAWIYRHDTQQVWLANAQGHHGKAADQPYLRVDLSKHFEKH